MTVLVYQNTKTTLPHWVPFHDKEPRGMAYETPTHFVHFYGKGSGLWVISSGLTVTEKKSGTLEAWIDKTFGAIHIQTATHAAGDTIESVWRPGLYFEDELLQGLKNSEFERRLAEQSLRILIQRLDEILSYIEPTIAGLKSFGHKTRELLILACTEVENSWKHHMTVAGVTSPARGHTTNDYVKLFNPLHLEEYEITLPLYQHITPVRPFLGWDSSNPTQSLSWYDAYNKTKHDRSGHFDKATLDNCIKAVAAALVMFCVRFGPFPLIHGVNTLTTLSNQMFSIKLCNCSPITFYVPMVNLPPNQRDDLICFNSQEILQARTVLPLQI